MYRVNPLFKSEEVLSSSREPTSSGYGSSQNTMGKLWVLIINVESGSKLGQTPGSGSGSMFNVSGSTSQFFTSSKVSMPHRIIYIVATEFSRAQL